MCFLLNWIKTALNISKSWPGMAPFSSLLNVQHFFYSMFITENQKKEVNGQLSVQHRRLLGSPMKKAFLLIVMCNDNVQRY